MSLGSSPKSASLNFFTGQGRSPPPLCMCAFSHVQLFANPWTVAHQVPLSVEFSRQEILQWVAISYSRGSSRSRDQTHIPCDSYTGKRILYHPCHQPLNVRGVENVRHGLCHQGPQQPIYHYMENGNKSKHVLVSTRDKSDFRFPDVSDVSITGSIEA